MFDATEAINDIIDEINSDYYESCYNAIYDELFEKVITEEISLEDAQMINEAAAEKYLTEKVYTKKNEQIIIIGKKLKYKTKQLKSQVKSAKTKEDLSKVIVSIDECEKLQKLLINEINDIDEGSADTLNYFVNECLLPSIGSAAAMIAFAVAVNKIGEKYYASVGKEFSSKNDKDTIIKAGINVGNKVFNQTIYTEALNSLWRKFKSGESDFMSYKKEVTDAVRKQNRAISKVKREVNKKLNKL